MVLPPQPCSQPAFCLWKNFSQRISLTREVRKRRNEGSSQRRPNNNDVTKHNQRPFVPPQGLQIIFRTISCEMSYRYYQAEKFTGWLWTVAMTYVATVPRTGPKKWRQTTLELKVNCTYNDQGDTDQTTDDQLQEDYQELTVLFLHVRPSICKSSCPLIVNGGGGR